MIKEFQYPSIQGDGRQGVLRVFELEQIPFTCKRVFSVVNAQADTVRGEHAHKTCNQLIICVAGAVRLICDNGVEEISMDMTPFNGALLVPAGVWAKQKYLHDNSVIIVFCDQSYDEADYLRDYEEFLNWKGLNQ